MRLLPENTIALIVDYQEKVLPQIHGLDSLFKRSEILIQGLRALEIPMLVTLQYKKGLGETVERIELLVSDAPHYDKTTFSCCTPEVMGALEASGRKNVILCGTEAHVCVLQTVVDLAAAGYTPVWVNDCISSRNPDDKKAAVKRALAEGAVMTTSESILFELLQKAGTDTFKAVSKLVK